MKPDSAILACAAALLLAACDPVHTDAVNALGGDPTGARNGPTHRPGQPCLLCHDGTLGNPNQFAVAGTIYRYLADKEPLQGATVVLKGADNSTHTTTTNAAGNFYVTPNQWMPFFPMHVTVSYGGAQVEMQSHVGREGSCAGCHFDPVAPDSPGHVFFYDAGAP